MENNKKQTALEWLIEQCPRIQTIASNEVIEQAKEMEKHQAPSWSKDCTCNDKTGVVFCCDECGLPFENRVITDEDIRKSVDQWFVKDLPFGAKEDEWFILGAKWYREQTKIKANGNI